MAANLVTAVQTAWDPPSKATLTLGKATRDTKLTTHTSRGPGRMNKVNLHSCGHTNSAVLHFTVTLGHYLSPVSKVFTIMYLQQAITLLHLVYSYNLWYT